MATPVIYEDRCYIGVGANPDDGPGAGHLWCIDITKTGDVTPADESYDPKSPKNKDSALVWHFGGKIVPSPARGRDSHFGRTMTMPAIKDGLLYTAELDGYFYCFDARTGKRHYEVDLRAGVWSSPYWVDNKVFLGTEDGELLVFAHGFKPRRLATIDAGPPIKAPVQVVDGVLYFMTNSELYAISCK
jgi:outer membrane protein assembly factor BamB